MVIQRKTLGWCQLKGLQPRCRSRSKTGSTNGRMRPSPRNRIGSPSWGPPPRCSALRWQNLCIFNAGRFLCIFQRWNAIVAWQSGHRGRQTAPGGRQTDDDGWIRAVSIQERRPQRALRCSDLCTRQTHHKTVLVLLGPPDREAPGKSAYECVFAARREGRKDSGKAYFLPNVACPGRASGLCRGNRR